MKRTQIVLFGSAHRYSYLWSRGGERRLPRRHRVGPSEEKPADTPKHLKYEQETTLAQALWLTLSSNAKQIFEHHSSWCIQLKKTNPTRYSR
jgi:hypothetical protein